MFAQISRAAASRVAQASGRRFASSSATKANAFNSERESIKQHADETTKLWLKISLACIPVIGLTAANCYRLWNEHWEHWSHLPPLEERTEYPYQNIRTKNYPWGNGDETLFWNSSVNYHNKNKVK
ncbi:hypothetical protein BROUX41_002730 [Berkeleyomyces rouxiae]|uniref:Cytochrome c oxidase subunit 13, mitochondrial n=1 Tax=Berkeleyomyces basicola TaxID=124036 RepID=A0A3G2LVX1_9PEZI|nr:cytochrome C oxidase subunit VIa [Berkeleyomyces basicola]